MATAPVVPGISPDAITWLDATHGYVKYSRCNQWVGIIELHQRADGSWCRGSVWFADRGTTTRTTWQVESESPLTLSPSILCTTCNSHGYIRNDAWIPA